MNRSPVRRVRINSIAIGPPNAAVVVPVYRPRLEIEISHFSASVYDITGNLWWPSRAIFLLVFILGGKPPYRAQIRVSLEWPMWLWMDSEYITARRTKYQISREACCGHSLSSMFLATATVHW